VVVCLIWLRSHNENPLKVHSSHSGIGWNPKPERVEFKVKKTLGFFIFFLGFFSEVPGPFA
jgi:hypothetical protein